MKNYFFKLSNFIFEPGFEVKLAETKEEFESAFKLLHDCYVNQGRIKPTASGLYCQLHHFLPDSVTVIAKYRGGVVGTISLFKDSTLGLTTEKFYPVEIAKIRRKGGRIVEASAMAITKHFRNKDAVVSHLLMKYIFLYSSRFLGASHLLMLKSPSKTDFYTKYWGLNKLGPTLSVHSGKDGRVQGLCMPLNSEQLKKITMSYTSPKIQRNLGVFLNFIDERYRFPQRRVGQIVDLIMTPDLLEHFFLQRTQLYEELDLRSRRVLLEIYVQLYGQNRMIKFLTLDTSFTLREYRMPVLAQSGIRVGEKFGNGKILDISTSGCYVQIPSQLEEVLANFKDEIILNFRIGEKAYEARGHVLWRNPGDHNRYPKGLGVRFTDPLDELKTEFATWVRDFNYDSVDFFTT